MSTKAEVKQLIREVLVEMGAVAAPPAQPPTPPMSPLEEKYMGFKKLVRALHKKGIKGENFSHMSDEELDEGAGALAAWIGRKKYGKAKFQKMAAAGKK